MRIFELTKAFPKEEVYSLTSQNSAVLAICLRNDREAWRRRRYEAAFVNKLNEAEGEATETQVWLEFSVQCGYLQKDTGKELYLEYDEIVRMLVDMVANSRDWTLPGPSRGGRA